MSPFIKDGDIILLSRPMAGRRLALGDIAAFQCNGAAIVVHRVIGRAGSRYLMKGDNNPRADGLIDTGEILARVVHVERNGKRVKLGLGRERPIVAILSRLGLLTPLLPCLRYLLLRRSK